MSRATPELRDFAQRLLAYEARGAKAPAATTPAIAVCEKLRPHLLTLMGRTGVRALVGRALALAQHEVPRMLTVQIRDDGSLTGVEADPPLDPELLREGGVQLVAELLGLLQAFVGEALTLRMLREVWPRLSLSELYFRNEDQK